MTRFPTAADKLEWVGKFLQQNLTALNQAEWANLQEDVHALSAWKEEGSGPIFGPHHTTLERVRALQQELREFLEACRWTKEEMTTRRSIGGPLLWRRPLQNVAGLVMYLTEGRYTFHIEADLTETVLFEVAQALTRLNVNDLQQCAACENPFIMRRQGQKFCSTKCNRKAALRYFRERERQKKAKKKQTGKRAG